MEQVRDKSPDRATSVIGVDDQRVGRLWITRTAEHIELCGIQQLFYRDLESIR